MPSSSPAWADLTQRVPCAERIIDMASSPKRWGRGRSSGHQGDGVARLHGSGVQNAPVPAHAARLPGAGGEVFELEAVDKAWGGNSRVQQSLRAPDAATVGSHLCTSQPREGCSGRLQDRSAGAWLPCIPPRSGFCWIWARLRLVFGMASRRQAQYQACRRSIVSKPHFHNKDSQYCTPVNNLPTEEAVSRDGS
jgi:hypothetical protein